MFCSFLSKGINSLSKSCENNINYNRKKFGNIIQFTFLYSTSKIFILTWCFRWSFRTVSKSRSWIFPDKICSFSFIQETNSSQELLNNWALRIRINKNFCQSVCKRHHYWSSVSTGGKPAQFATIKLELHDCTLLTSDITIRQWTTCMLD